MPRYKSGIQLKRSKVAVLPIWIVMSFVREKTLLFISDEGPTLETLDFTVHIGSTPTFLYFDSNLLLMLTTKNQTIKIRPRCICYIPRDACSGETKHSYMLSFVTGCLNQLNLRDLIKSETPNWLILQEKGLWLNACIQVAIFIAGRVVPRRSISMTST